MIEYYILIIFNNLDNMSKIFRTLPKKLYDSILPTYNIINIESRKTIQVNGIQY
jgi:hypothetical protein